jgi:hypothetical protein
MHFRNSRCHIKTQLPNMCIRLSSSHIKTDAMV